MDLLLKRNEIAGAMGTRFDLFAKLELKPEELSRVRKANPGKTVIFEDEYGKNSFKWKLMLIPAGIGAIILGMIAFYLIHPILGLPVMIIALFAFRRLFFNQVSGNVTVAHLLTGRTIHCKSLDELYMKENEIKEKISNYCKYHEGMAAQANEQRIDLSRG